jgi:hypothetical protein
VPTGRTISRERPTRGGPAVWGFLGEPETPHRKKARFEVPHKIGNVTGVCRWKDIKIDLRETGFEGVD